MVLRPALSCVGAALALWAGMAVAQQVGPGPDPATPGQAAEIFATVCAATQPDFGGAPAAIAALPLRQNPETGTFYHRDLDLSVKLHRLDGDSVCSVVFSATGGHDAVRQAFAKAVFPAVGARIAFQDGSDGLLSRADLPGRASYELTVNTLQGVTMYRGLIAAGQ